MKTTPAIAKKCLELAGVQLVSSVEIAIPPSTNHLFSTVYHRKKNVHVRIPTEVYKDWQAQAIPKLQSLRGPVRYPCEIRVEICGKINMMRDLDNMLKPIGDAIVKAGVLSGDSARHVRKWTIEYISDRQNAVAIVSIVEAEHVVDLLTGVEQ
jgi:Holliday junction resolvase RusA-like endonuclease